MYYFAYGSSMSLDHIRRICGWHAHLLGRARLPDFEFGVDLRGYANIRAKKAEEVHGMLYEIDEDGLGILDEFEGYPQVFDRKEILVYDDHRVKYKAQVYLEPPEQFDGSLVREEHFRRLVAAAYENRLPEEWIKKLEDIGKGKQKV